MALILNFPYRGAPMTPDEIRSLLLEAHAALIDAVIERQDNDGGVAVTLSLDEAMEMCRLIEESIGPEWFDDNLD